MQDRQHLYVDGAWVAPVGAGTIDVVDSATGEPMARVPECSQEDVERAVAAARAAFGDWSRSPLEERARLLEAITGGLQARTGEIATTVAREVGTPINLSALVHVGLPTMTFGAIPEILRSFPFEEEIGNSLVLREPAGVVGCMTPWNFPLHQIAAKVAPGLAAGCTIVVKPSEVAPLSAFVLAEVADEAGLPPGVLNLVTGGPAVGEALAAHPGVDMISFTGSLPAGTRVSEVAARTVKRVVLELGGKSPNVILDDADLRPAVTAGMSSAFLNCGQSCVAQSRMLVDRPRLAQAEGLAARLAASYTVGDPLDERTRLGPLASEQQRRRVWGYVRRGIEDGAKLVAGGLDVPATGTEGFFVRATVFSDVHPDMAIAREEIFGPVLSILPYDTEDEAVEIANDSIYGLSAAVWSADDRRAHRVARRLRSGQVEVNGGTFNPIAPFGGYKQSGTGRELGRFGLEEFLETKSVQI